MILRRRPLAGLAIPVALALAASLAACTAPAPTPTSSAPAAEPPAPSGSPTPSVDALALTPDGLGDLRLGSPIATSLFEFAPEYCREIHPGQDWTDEHAGEWLPTSALTAVPVGARPAVEIFGADGVLTLIQIQTKDVRTPEGIGLGSTVEEVAVAYPAARVDQTGALSDLYVVPGAVSSLLVEVASPRAGEGYWRAEEVDRVTQLRSVLSDESLLRPIAGSDGYAYCQL